MSVMFVFVQAALAEGTGVWLRGTPDPTQERALEHVDIDRLLAAEGWTEADDRAVNILAAELNAVQPLLDVFDGELQIMLRLEAALDPVTTIREQDRDLMFRVLLFQGLAVERYFQDALADDPGAAPYRIEINGQVYNRPWVDAIAMVPERSASEAEIPEAPERLLFQDLRATHLLAPAMQVMVPELPAGMRLVVNGLEATADRVRVLPGKHHAALLASGRISARAQAVLVPGNSTLQIEPTALDVDVEALAGALSENARVVAINTRMVNTLEALPQPVHLFVGDGRRVHHYVVEDRTAVQVDQARVAASTEGVRWRALAGGSWIYDGDYLLQNNLNGAPEALSTVNAAAPLLSAGVETTLGPVVAGAGLDALLPLGEWHALPSGEQTVRLRAYPHIEAGVGPARVTVGWLFPWHIGVGPRVRHVLDVGRGLELSAAYVHGIGVSQSQGSDTFSPDRVQTAWLGVGLLR